MQIERCLISQNLDSVEKDLYNYTSNLHWTTSQCRDINLVYMDSVEKTCIINYTSNLHWTISHCRDIDLVLSGAPQSKRGEHPSPQRCRHWRLLTWQCRAWAYLLPPFLKCRRRWNSSRSLWSPRQPSPTVSVAPSQIHKQRSSSETLFQTSFLIALVCT